MALVSVELGTDDLELVARFVLRLGGYAEGLFDYHDFGFEKQVLQNHITQVEEDIRRVINTSGGSALNLRPPNLPVDAIWEEADETWNYGQSLRFAAGASMITERYRERMTPENLRRAFIAKILHECQAGILDDLVDKGRYTFIEAKDLYHHCFASMIDPGFDLNSFRRELALILKQEQLGMFDLMTNITAAFNKLYLGSPNGQDLFYEMERVNERVILGQALTMFHKQPTLDIPKLRRISSGFSAPDPDVAWHERLANYVSHATNHSVIDMCFLSDPVSPAELHSTTRAWYYYDVVIVHLNNIVGVQKDLRSGLVNLALISMREEEVSRLTNLQGYNLNLTVRDYEDQFARTAEFSRRAIRAATRDLEDGAMFYPFITIMIPVVMMADWIGNRDNLIHEYLRMIAPAIRDNGQEGRQVVAEIARPAVRAR
ncbi:MAG: hypothetical protein A3K65_04365 [Euryarchaeota archaeon RBG_16_68_12]|nr:MAG: hypothetical protein A3K65_04365 [Euryarchaeota archaeon RBG_16_68_12]